MLHTILLAVIPALTAPAPLSTWYVDDDATGSGTGSISDPFSTIQMALDAPTTQAGDVILVFEGTYSDPFVISGVPIEISAVPGTGDVELLRTDFDSDLVTIRNVAAPGITLAGLKMSSATLALGSGRLISIENAQVSFESCSILGTGTNFHSGALLASAGSSVTMLSCEISENEGGQHASGLSFFDSDAAIHDCVFRDNPRTHFSFDGGAIYFRGDAQDELVVTNSLFTGNNAYDGSGAKIAGSASATFSDCQFLSNGDGFNNSVGGALSGHGTVERCVFRFNTGREGGAIYGEWMIYDSLFEGNTGTDGEDHATAVQGLGDTQLHGCVIRDNWGTTFSPFQSCSSVVNATVASCVFESNVTYHTEQSQALSGGAITNCVAIDCTFIDNVASGSSGPFAGRARGGAAVNSTLLRCILIGNESQEGGAVFDCTLESCTITGNSADLAGASLDSDLNSCIVIDCGAAPVVGGTTIYSSIESGMAGLGNIASAPLFWGPASGDVHLTAASPCIDTGDPALLDPDGSRRDMGAFPFDPGYTGLPNAFCEAGPDGAACTPSLEGAQAASLSQGLDLRATGMRNSSLALVFLSSQSDSTPYLNGSLCLGGSLRRGPLGTFNQGTAPCGNSFDFSIPGVDLINGGFQPGALIYAQVVYRDLMGGMPVVSITGALESRVRP